MHIEKINENKFRCTLEKRDLDMRNLRLEELAYGTDKARQLFDEMMRKAHDQFGFSQEEGPISVEAFPISKECLVLVISKMTNFDEVDTRFSRFSEQDEYAESPIEEEDGLDGYSPEIITSEPPVQKDTSDLQRREAADGEELIRVFTFRSLDILLDAAQVLHKHYNGVNSLYKDEKEGIYYLVLKQTFHTADEFSKACNMLTEYGVRLSNPEVRYAYCKEHYHCMVEQTALQRLFLF